MRSLPKVVIVGAGIGGLSTAAHLAKRGFNVTILEKNSQPGGRCGVFSHKGHIFDVGPTLYVMPLVYESELAHLGLHARQALELQQVHPTYHIYFDDGSRFTLTSNMDHLVKQVETFESGSTRSLHAYLEEGKRCYRLAMTHLVQRDFRRITDFLNPRILATIFEIHALQRHYKRMGKFFDDPRLKAAFTFQDMYMGLSPSEAPASFSLLPYTELSHGIWFPRGGMNRIVEVLHNAAVNAGAQLRLNTPVQRIDVKGRRVRGVTLANGEHLPADVIVANADLPYVYQELLPRDGTAESLTHKRYSCSTLSFFWGLKRSFPELQAHMLFLAQNYLEGFDALRKPGLPDEPNLYVHCPSRLDPAMAPSDRETLIGIVPIGHLHTNPHADWSTIQDHARRTIFARLSAIGLHDLQDHIDFEVVYTPETWHTRYNLYKGATHGMSHTLTQMAYMRPHNRHRRYLNLYFVGASTHPGTGVPTVLISARLAAERIVDELD